MTQAESDPDFVYSLERGLRIIRTFGPGAESLTMAEVAHRTDLSRAVVRRFLHTLVELGYVAVEGRHYRLRPRILDLGYTYLGALPFWESVQPELQQVSQQVEATCSASVLDGEDVVHVARANWFGTIAVGITIGARLPAIATAMGRTQIAALPPEDWDRYIGETPSAYTPRTETDPARLRAMLQTIRAQGFAIVDQELSPGLLAAAVPIRDHQGRVIAALGTSEGAGRLDPAGIEKMHVPLLLAASARITDALHR